MRFAFSLLVLTLAVRLSAAPVPDYAAVDTIFSKHCLDCHDSKEPEAKLVLENYDALMKGGENGAALVAGKSSDSLLVKMVEGKITKDGKALFMPPKKRTKLDPQEIATIKAWIDAGAKPPAIAIVKEINVPEIKPKVAPRNPVNAIAHIPGSSNIALGRYSEVQVCSAENGSLIRTLAGHHGNVNALVVSAHGHRLYSAAGEDARFGEVKVWNIADGSLLRTFQGHKDAIYSMALSPDGKILATGSYDQKIKLWDVGTGKETKTLSGHNGCVYGLAFRPDGKILASASGDRTVKLWDVASGTRRDTLAQPLKDLYTLAFTPDGKKLVAGGVDSRIRTWQISENAAETTNPILESKFAHEGAVLHLAFSVDGQTLASTADDRTVKIWNFSDMRERVVLEKQPDWAPALDFVSSDKIALGRLDGSVAFYDFDGKLLDIHISTDHNEKLSKK
ncbi:MAG: Planctomycete cytochrome [Verrucomicrobiales bacterium]|nr:Planctomycete cytochrome [Verrucomicrobiales bacterium]